MATITIRVSDKEKAFLQHMANFEGTTISNLFKSKTFEQLEDEYDLIELRKAKAESTGDYTSFADLDKELGLD